MNKALRSLLRSLVTLSVFLASYSVQVSAQDIWESQTSFGNVRQFLPVGDTVYAVTSGGLLRIVDPLDPPKAYLNLNGFGTVDLYEMTRDNNGIDWIAAAGRVIRRSPDGSIRQIPLLDLDGNLFDALSLADDGTRLWVGTSIGLVVIDKTAGNGEVAEFYDRFADLNTGAAVNGITLTGDSIWLATNVGLAVARRTDLIALNAPSSWTGWNVVDYPVFGTDTIRHVVSFQDSIYVSTGNGAFSFDRSVDPPVVRQIPLTSNQPITDLVRANDSLFISTQTDLVITLPGQGSIAPSNRPIRTMTSTNTRRWFNGLNGIINYTDQSGTSVYQFIGLPSNDIADVALLPAENAGIRQNKRVFPLQGNSRVVRNDEGLWTELFVPPGWTSNNIIALDNQFVASALEGGGIVIIDGTAETPTSSRYDTSGTTLRGVSEGPNFIPVRDLSVSNGILYAACYRAYNGYPVSFVPVGQQGNRSSWDSLGFADGIFDQFVITVDAFGDYLAVGTEGNGVFICYIGPDPFNKSDDNCVHLTETSGNLISNAVRVVRFSSEGELWIGTNFGLSRIEPSIETRCTDVNLPSGFGPDLTDLEFDSRETLWLGATNGLAKLEIADARFTRFTSSDSPLLSNQVRSVSVDPLTNDLFVSTPNGMSILRSGQGILTDDPTQLLASPNPFYPETSGARLRFNFSGNGTLAVFTATGDLVYASATLEWDGRNSAGEPVASGVYLFTINNGSDASGRGKFLLIRR